MVSEAASPPALRRVYGDATSEAPALDADALEAAYAHEPGRLRANFVVTLDGAVEIGGHSGGIGGDADREVLATLRALADVVVVGAGTARAESYGPAWLTAARRERRARRGQPPLPTMAVVTRSAELDPASRLFAERRTGQPAPPAPLVFTSGVAPVDRRGRLAEVADVRVIGQDALDLAAMVASLRADGHQRILCEGGPRLFGDLLGAGLVHELCLTHSPWIAGTGRTTLSQGWAPDAGEAPARFALTDLFSGDGRLFARYRGQPA
ncbi:MAG: pyrimidine reductase family protein [Acidimicrobiales bacterium]